MDLSKILSISGKSGLFKVVSQLKNSVLVESLTDKRRFPAFPHEKISSLEEIAVFTTGEDMPFKEVLKAIHEKQAEKPAPDAKSDSKTLASFFESVIPDYDKERVYISDIKKILTWYNTLLENDLLDFTEEVKEEEKPEETAPADEEEAVKVKKPAKKPAEKKEKTAKTSSAKPKKKE